jgi:hypothetical protein
MEFLNASLAGEDVFRGKFNAFSTTNAACVYSGLELESISLHDYIQQFGERQNVYCGDIPLLPQRNRLLDAEQEELVCLSAM